MQFHALFAIIVATLLLAPPAAALEMLDYGKTDITITLQPGQDEAYLIPMKAGDRLVVNLAVTSGGPVDFYLSNLTAYRVYSASVSGTLNFPSLYYLAEQSSEGAMAISYAYDTYAANEYVLLIDNTANTEGGASPQGPVTVSGHITVERNIWTAQNIAITVAVVVAIVLFMAYARWPRKKP